ncbi:MAG: DUF2974 domain-containing protein [Bacilli bacterium]|nr:DUF2974 domain-containing protein [Bacilli bacterium]
MNNIFDYINYYKNTSFKEYNYNEIDSLMFALLSYVEFDEIIPGVKGEYIYLNDAIEIYLDKFKNVNAKDENWLFPKCYELMESLKDSIRYKDMKLYYYRKIVDHETQFSAMTIRIKNITYISYRGTDSSIIGWKEDFELFYKYPVVSQELAMEYFNNTINFFDRNIYLGGHSKGGNLAMYAYMYGNNNYKRRVINVYNFDGPGFLDDVVDSDLYKELASKLLVIVPKYSIVGMILNNEDYVVVNCHDRGIWAHDGFNWEVFGGFFVETTLSKKSKRLRDNFNDYIDKMSLDEREAFVKHTFDIFKKMGIKYTDEIQNLRIGDILKLMKDIKDVPGRIKTRWITIIKLLLIG